MLLRGDPLITRRTAVLATIATAIVLGVWVTGQQPPRQEQAARQESGQSGVSKAQFEKWMTELSNWGRWGKDDERGALNLITGDSVLSALTVPVGHKSPANLLILKRWI